MLPCLMFAGTIVTYYILQETCQNTSKPKIFHLFFGIFGETLYLCTRKQWDYPCFVLQKQGWFGSSVGLEQQPSKLRVKGSSPFRITKLGIKWHLEVSENESSFCFLYGTIVVTWTKSRIDSLGRATLPRESAFNNVSLCIHPIVFPCYLC